MSEQVIIDSGATKSDWRVLAPDGRQLRQTIRSGMNVSAMRLEDVRSTLLEGLKAENLPHAKGVYLYTAGVVTDEIRRELEAAIREAAPESEIDIQDDLMGAARAVCGHGSGIVAILGTGSNTCFYDGITLTRKVYSGGYVIGDEGGGACLGKLFLADFIKGLVPEPVAGEFAEKHDASYQAIVEGVYRSPSPSGYLGSIAPFLLERKDNAYVKSLIESNFRAFIERALLKYDTANYPVGIVGGFGRACQEILTPLLEEYDIKVKCFLKAPVEGLIKYYI
ncbi:MAG: hypothetical protein IK045_00340 [Bacteroidales bacterium]|nr:hypothetical protein [Bacteroidales bacterium]